MRRKLIIFLTLFFIIAPEGLSLAKENVGLPAFKPDGVNVSAQRRKRRHRRNTRKRTKVYAIEMGPAEAGAPDAEPVGGSSPMDAPGRGRSSAPAKKSAPKIKPPTVQIKPPTE